MSDLRDLLRSLSPEEKRALRRGLRKVEKQLLKDPEKPRSETGLSNGEGGFTPVYVAARPSGH